MTKNPRQTMRPSPKREPPAREGDVKQPARERERRISEAQIAAPSTRRWRRAGRFSRDD